MHPATVAALAAGLLAAAFPASAMVAEDGGSMCGPDAEVCILSQDSGSGIDRPTPGPTDFNGVPPGTRCEGLGVEHVGQGSLRLWWPSVPGADAYQVREQRMGDESMLLFPQVPPSTNTTQLDGLHPGWWQFHVVAVHNGTGLASFCAIAHVAWPCWTGVAASAASDGIEVTWPQRADATGYVVFAEHEGTVVASPVFGPEVTGWLFEAAEAGATYTFTVQASLGVFDWADSCPAAGTTGAAVPFFPGMLPLGLAVGGLLLAMAVVRRR